jgi:predicted N-acyltransferase
MYMPYVRKAHSYSALPVTLQEVLRMLRGGGELVMTLRDGHAVAGEFIIFDENKAYSRILGIRDGSSELIKHGAVAACYYNTIQHVREKGFDTLHFGGSRPFLQDGLLRYKKKWGLRLTGFDRSGHYLAFPSMSAGAKSFLESNPFIFVRNRELWGGVFGAEVKSDCRQMDSRMHELAIDGLRGIEVFNTANPIEQMFEAPRCVTLASPAIS